MSSRCVPAQSPRADDLVGELGRGRALGVVQHAIAGEAIAGERARRVDLTLGKEGGTARGQALVVSMLLVDPEPTADLDHLHAQPMHPGAPTRHPDRERGRGACDRHGRAAALRNLRGSIVRPPRAGPGVRSGRACGSAVRAEWVRRVVTGLIAHDRRQVDAAIRAGRAVEEREIVDGRTIGEAQRSPCYRVLPYPQPPCPGRGAHQAPFEALPNASVPARSSGQYDAAGFDPAVPELEAGPSRGRRGPPASASSNERREVHDDLGRAVASWLMNWQTAIDPASSTSASVPAGGTA